MKTLKQFDVRKTVGTFDVLNSLNTVFYNFIIYKEDKYQYDYYVYDYIMRFLYKILLKKITSEEKNHNVWVSISDRIHTARNQSKIFCEKYAA